MSELPSPDPNLQISFHYKLKEITEQCLEAALQKAIQELDVRDIDQELAAHVDPVALKQVAMSGLRGELIFPLPIILKKNPFLIAYYRLLLGFSQKDFYRSGNFGKFKRLEERGEIGSITDAELVKLCVSLSLSCAKQLEGIDILSIGLLRDLQILTIGAQLRGGENNRIGRGATLEIFDTIRMMVDPYLRQKTNHTLVLENDSGRKVMIEFASNPDVRITQALDSGVRPIVSVEIKGGTDASNIHNRLGEAEKSHQKARRQGFFEFWTIVRANVNIDLARKESPTTSRFFNLNGIKDPSSQEHQQFKDLLASLIGIRVM